MPDHNGTFPDQAPSRAERNSCSHPGSCLALSLPLFHCCSGKDRQRFQRLAAVHVYHRGNILFYQGNRPQGLYLICRGRVKIAKEDRGGRSQIVRIVHAPDLLGDRAFFAERPYAGTGEVMEESKICFLEGRHFWELFGKNAGMLRVLAQRFARELGRAEEYMSCVAGCTVVAQLTTHLLRGGEQPSAERARKDEFVLTESRTELAQLLGKTPEAVSRALAELCSKGLIAVQGRHVRVLNEDRLRRIACLHDSVS